MKTLTTEEKQELKNRFENILSIDDLVEVINYVYQELLAGNEISKDDVLSNADLSNKRYHTFSIRKKTGGERVINRPMGALGMMQKALSVIFTICMKIHPKAMGFTEGKSVVTNAQLHIGKNYVYNIDLKDFFHSFKKWQIKRIFTQTPFQLPEEIANYLASLCVHTIDIDGKKEQVLPQGAPTSPILTNILCKKMDIALDKLAKKYKATYSRYADDITFSSNKSVFNNPIFLQELEAIIHKNKLQINPKKTRLQKKTNRQEVTGITVNEKLNTTRKYVKQIRMWLYLIEKYGAKKAETIFRKDYIKEKGHIKYNQNPMFSVIGGKLLYLKMVKSQEDSTYQKLAQRFDKICGFNVDAILDVWEKEGKEKAMEVFEATKSEKWKKIQNIRSFYF
ncbi:reverse transcriptase domain-containing protein [Capnocytophaga canis]|uniref:RNA-directed DNA polymerase n=1 Tax=Capnocytophaga canis TaxID=1848903 RepID=A0A0B7I2U6_9FLAO|nr:reverse transcriptase domain-containing protein [Capnocytophaga canis]CEN44427.1 RNA-directed DNA polymerase [Capnocytophaga canis]